MSNASYAIRFAASFPGMCMVLSGMSDLAQMKDNLSFMRDFKPLDAEEIKALTEVRNVFYSLGMIPCTSCHYCVLDNKCPRNISIPEMISCFTSSLTRTFSSSASPWATDTILAASSRAFWMISSSRARAFRRASERICSACLSISFNFLSYSSLKARASSRALAASCCSLAIR